MSLDMHYTYYCGKSVNVFSYEWILVSIDGYMPNLSNETKIRPLVLLVLTLQH